MTKNGKKTFSVEKDPHSVLDYQVNWATWLDGDTIVASTWDVTAGLTNEDDSNTTATATVWLSGGQANTYYTVINHITTAAGREEDAQINFTVTNTF